MRSRGTAGDRVGEVADGAFEEEAGVEGGRVDYAWGSDSACSWWRVVVEVRRDGCAAAAVVVGALVYIGGGV